MLTYVCCSSQELDQIVAYELKTGGVLLHPIFGGGKEKDKYVYLSCKSLQGMFLWGH